MKGGFGNFFKQAQDIQAKFQQMQEDLEKSVVVGESGAGMVKVEMNGRHDVTKVFLDDSLLQEEKTIIEDLVAAAVNAAVQEVEALKAKSTGDLGITLPPGFKMPF